MTHAEVFDALLLMAAGSWTPDDLKTGHQRVMQLTRDMDEGRRKRQRRRENRRDDCSPCQDAIEGRSVTFVWRAWSAKRPFVVPIVLMYYPQRT
jgi:hypothetical protein